MSLRSEIELDYARWSGKKGNIQRYMLKMLSKHGFRAIVLYRLGHWFYERGFHRLAGLMEKAVFYTCFCEISAAALIEPGVMISHTVGLVVGGGTHIGAHCDLRQNVTFGGNYNKTGEDGRSQPWLEENVSVGAGAVIVGPIRVGANAVIGANSVVTKDVPKDAIVSGIPMKVLRIRWAEDENRKL